MPRVFWGFSQFAPGRREPSAEKRNLRPDAGNRRRKSVICARTPGTIGGKA
ncbi:MAG: hypothetical protein LBU37_14555 [Tannerellaceae bacterium]|nr:hypothetical protein [Tannerellaceae bacterium]